MKNHKLTCHCGAVELRGDLLDGVKMAGLGATCPAGLGDIPWSDGIRAFQHNIETLYHSNNR
jgi:hypothetical protein